VSGRWSAAGGIDELHAHQHAHLRFAEQGALRLGHFRRDLRHIRHQRAAPHASGKITVAAMPGAA